MRGVDVPTRSPRRRGWLVKRALLAADVAGLLLAYFLAKLVVSGPSASNPLVQVAVLVLAIGDVDRRGQEVRALRA